MGGLNQALIPEEHDEALANVRAAIRTYVEVAEELEKPVPEPKAASVSS